MKISKRDGRPTRKIITAMVVSTPVLAAVSDRWDDSKGMFGSKWPNIIGGWCVKYYRKYGKAPRGEIESLFSRWADRKEGKKDEETIRLVERFLDSISGQYTRERKKINIQYTIDLAAEHFNSVKAEDTCETVKGLLDDGKIVEALSQMDDFKKIEMKAGKRISVLRDKQAIFQAFEERGDPLITFDGPNDFGLAEFFGSALLRDTFFLFEGPEKRGKTWIMLDMAWRAMQQGRRVAMFQVGDLSQPQIMRRFMTRASGRPLEATTKGKHVKVPVGLSPPRDESGIAHVVHKEKRWKEDLTKQEAWKASKLLSKGWGKGLENELLFLDVYANSSISINGISSVLASWKREIGWVPDLLVIDYADILAPIDGKVDTRFQIDATHRGMKRLSQEYHLCLISATQTNKESYDAPTIEMKHSAESKTKHAHANGIIGINRSEEEKKLGLYRFNWVVGREWDYSSDVCVYTAGSLALANPMMFSTM